MNKTTLTVCVLFVVSLSSLAQSPKRKPTQKPKPKMDSSKPFETRCGVHFKNMDEFLEEIMKEDEWTYAGESTSEFHYYNFKKSTCDDKGIWKIWIKAVEKDTAKTVAYSMNRYELNCRSDQLRIISVTDYNKAGEVQFPIYTPSDPTWEDVVPDSVGEHILKTACRKSLQLFCVQVPADQSHQICTFKSPTKRSGSRPSEMYGEPISCGLPTGSNLTLVVG